MKMRIRCELAAYTIALSFVATCDAPSTPRSPIIGTYDVSMRLDSLHRFRVCSGPHGPHCDTTEAVGSSNLSAVRMVNSATRIGDIDFLRDVEASLTGRACGATASTCFDGTSGYGIDTTWMRNPTAQLTASGDVTIGLTKSTVAMQQWPQAFKLQGVFAGDSIRGAVIWEPSSYVHGFAIFSGKFVARKL